MDMSTYTLEELEHITSEYTLRNQVSGTLDPLFSHTLIPIPTASKSPLHLGLLGYLFCGRVLPDRPDCLYF